MSGNWGAIFAKHLVLIAAGALVGGWYGNALGGLAIALAAALGWHLYCLLRFIRWLHADNYHRIPFGSGVWPSVFARAQHFRNRNAFNKGRFVALAERWRRATDALPDAAFVLNDAFEIQQYNSLARAMLDLRGDVDRGQPVTNLIRHPDFVAMIERRNFPDPVRIPAPNNPDLTVSCRILRLGERQYLLLIRDISARTATERMRVDFIANASHELRTPLTVLLGYLTAIDDDKGIPEAWLEPLAEMKEHAQRMEMIVGDMLRLSQLEAAPGEAGQEPVDIAMLIQAAVRDANASKETNVEICVSIESEARLLGEKSELRSVLSNLLTNALRFTPDGGKISVAWRVTENHGEVVVADTGIGIDNDDLARVTERFFRADSGRARHEGGTGLGLAIVKHALARHEASLEIESEPGIGSTFLCRFPADRIASRRLPESTGQTILARDGL